MATNGRLLRGESRWIVRARISFPEPVSPVISTDAIEGDDLLHHAHDVLHRFRPPHHVAETSRLSQLARERHDLPPSALESQRAIEQRAQDGRLERLFDIPERTGLDRRDDALLAALACDQNRRQMLELAGVAQPLE